MLGQCTPTRQELCSYVEGKPWLFIAKKAKNSLEKPKGGKIIGQKKSGVAAVQNSLFTPSQRKILQFIINNKLQYLCDRNRRVSVTLSPTLTLFLEPHGKLYLKLQQVLAQLQMNANTPLPPAKRRRLGPAKSKHGIPPKEWPTVLRRITENQEPLRKVAGDYGVSYETIRRVVRAARKQ